jgi:hypothetical protein
MALVNEVQSSGGTTHEPGFGGDSKQGVQVPRVPDMNRHTQHDSPRWQTFVPDMGIHTNFRETCDLSTIRT